MKKLNSVAAGPLVRRTLGLALVVAATSAFANDVDPFGFEKDAFIWSRTRADVVAELKAAQANSELPVPGEIGVRFVDAPSTKPRAQVVAETLEAARLGLLRYDDAQGPVQATAEQARLIEIAGMRALERLSASRQSPSGG